jgi:TRAP-type C4-dicarboxylate transport system permease small subunit
MRSTLKATLTALYWAEASLATAAYVGVAGLLLVDVLSRELLGEAVWGAQKFAVFGAVVAGFLGMVLATASNTHLRTQFADSWLPNIWAPAVGRVGDIISMLLYIGFGFVAIDYVSTTIANDERAAVISVALWPFQMVLPYAFFSSALRHFSFAAFPNLKPVSNLDVG